MLKRFLVHDTYTLQAQSLRIIVAFATIVGFKAWSADVKLAYLQANQTLQRRNLIENPALEFLLQADQIFDCLNRS